MNKLELLPVAHATGEELEMTRLVNAMQPDQECSS